MKRVIIVSSSKRRSFADGTTVTGAGTIVSPFTVGNPITAVTELPATGTANVTYRLTAQVNYFPAGDYVYFDSQWRLLSLPAPAALTIDADTDFDGDVAMGADYIVTAANDCYIAPVVPTDWTTPGSVRIFLSNPNEEAITFTGITWLSTIPAAPINTLIILTYDGTQWFGSAEELA